MFHRDDPDERLYFSRPRALDGIELMSAYNSFEQWHVYHERYDICTCRTAQAAMLYRGRHDPILDRSTSFFEPGEFHRNTEVHKRSDFKVLMIEPHVLDRAADQLDGGGHPHFRVAQVVHEELFRSVYALCAAIENGCSPLEQQSRLAHCLRLFLEQTERPPRRASGVRPSAIERAKGYLVDNFGREVTLDELANVARLSPYHLVHAFTSRIGMPPHRFQIHVRVEKAATLLRRGMTAADAATAVGFADQSHLNRHFKRVWGITAGAYAHVS